MISAFMFIVYCNIAHNRFPFIPRFSEVHGFVKPNDENAVKLMNHCAMAIMEMFSDVVFAYGFNDEYR